MVAILRSGTPSAFARLRAAGANAVLHTSAVGIFLFSNSTESWVHHDAHPPQSPRPVTTASHDSASSANISLGTGRGTIGFIRSTMRTEG